jgi:ABC-type transporter Mla MlaB component
MPDPDGTRQGNIVNPKQLSEQLIIVDEPQEVYSASSLVTEIREALLEQGDIRIDLKGAVRIHSAVLQVLIASQKSCRGARRSFLLSGISAELQPLLQMANLPVS